MERRRERWRDGGTEEERGVGWVEGSGEPVIVAVEHDNHLADAINLIHGSHRLRREDGSIDSLGVRRTCGGWRGERTLSML
jgi:hypothetical protein